MTAAIRAGIVYFAFVFIIGFGLGTIRVLFVIPRLGELVAVMLELPVMLGGAWLVCGRVISRWQVPDRAGPRAAMGAMAFVLLMIAELALAVLVFGRTPAQHFAAYGDAAGWLGLAGQIVFALLPLWRGRR
jgi:hypothetical protein